MSQKLRLVGGLLAAVVLAAGISSAVQAAEYTCNPTWDHALIGAGALADANYDGAIVAYSCVIAMMPDEIEGYRGKIEAEMRAGQFMRALEDMVPLAAGPGNGSRGIYGQLVAAYRDAIAANPDDPWLYVLRGFFNWHLEVEASTIRDMNRALERDPNLAYAYLLRGSSQIYAGFADDAQVDFERAIELAPEDAGVLEFIGLTYSDAHQPDLAFEYLEQAFALGITSSMSYVSRADMLSEIDQLALAGRDYLTYVERVAPQRVDAPPLTLDTPLAIHVEAGQTLTIPFEMLAGQTYTIRTASDYHHIDPVIVLLDADAVPLAGSDDNYNIYDSAVRHFTPTTSATYTLLLTTFGGAYRGDIDVILEVES